MTLAERKPRTEPKGRDKPRLCPPTPARSQIKEFESVAAEIGIALYPWQRSAARYITALGPGDRWLYREAAIVVARQNGKTKLLVPFIVSRLRMGRRIMHTAQNRELPREVFAEVADILSQDQTLFPERNGRAVRPRFANGQEEIRLANGGIYRIVAPTRGGARGPSNDDVIIDELREMDTFDFVAAAKPTLMASPNPQTIYLSNAGEDDSIVLNTIRARSEEDPGLAYLEWSAGPDRASDDRAGWLEANPSVGHRPMVMENLESDYLSHKLAGTLAIFEVENLCRWVTSTRERLVDDFAWAACVTDTLEAPKRPALAVSMAPEGTRASVAMAWQQSDGTMAVKLLFDVSPFDTDTLGKDLAKIAARFNAVTGFDPLTDAELVKYVKESASIAGQKLANASSQFVNLVTANRLRWRDGDAITDDLNWTARKTYEGEKGAYQAVRSRDDRPITAALAAIRAVWLASGPRPVRLKVF